MHLQTTYWCIILTASYVSSRHKHRHQTINGRVSFEGSQVWRASLRNSKNVIEIKSLVDEGDISVWHLEPTHVDFLVHAEQKVKVHRRLHAQKMNHTVILMNVQRRLDSLNMSPALWTAETLRLGHRLDFSLYPQLDVIEEYLSFVKDQYKSICTIETIGYTVENRSIQMAVVSNKNPKNKAILITGGLHAREWVAISSVLYILNDLLTRFDSQPNHVMNKDWYIIPVLNPDGYEYSHTTNRLWRKNRRHVTALCDGVDVNRNFGVHWYVDGVTATDPCSETYSGPSPFSEAETIALQSVAQRKNMSAFVDIHSYGQELMYPWTAISKSTPHDMILHAVATDMSAAIFNNHKINYRIGSLYNTVYPTSGSSVDFMYASGVHLAFGIEARDTGDWGFLLPAEKIVDTGIELQAAMYSLAQALEPKFRSEDCHTWF